MGRPLGQPRAIPCYEFGRPAQNREKRGLGEPEHFLRFGLICGPGVLQIGEGSDPDEGSTRTPATDGAWHPSAGHRPRTLEAEPAASGLVRPLPGHGRIAAAWGPTQFVRSPKGRSWHCGHQSPAHSRRQPGGCRHGRSRTRSQSCLCHRRPRPAIDHGLIGYMAFFAHNSRHRRCANQALQSKPRG